MTAHDDSDDDDDPDLPSRLTIFVLGLLAGAIAAGLCLSFFTDTAEKVRRDAVKAGAAHYVADEDGAPEFTWIKEQP